MKIKPENKYPNKINMKSSVFLVNVVPEKKFLTTYTFDIFQLYRLFYKIPASEVNSEPQFEREMVGVGRGNPKIVQ